MLIGQLGQRGQMTKLQRTKCQNKICLSALTLWTLLQEGDNYFEKWYIAVTVSIVNTVHI